MIRLKLKQELKIAVIGHGEPGLESQDELWNQFIIEYHINGLESLKSKFTIKRK